MEGGGEEVKVMIVGAGPAGLATAACLNRLSIPNVVIEREDCCASLWKRRAYDRLKLHLGKEFCNLPHVPFPSDAPRFVPRLGFVYYLDDYVSRFEINPRYRRSVESASYDASMEKWCVRVLNTFTDVVEAYVAEFLVVATGENSKGVIPHVTGLDTFKGTYMHSNEYGNGKPFEMKNVLVVGSGNSGMEIAYDLSNHGARTSIVVRSQVHVLTKDLVYFGMRMLKYLPTAIVDKMVVAMSKLKYGDTSKYGIQRPKMGPFEKKQKTGRTPTIDVGALDKICKGEIRVFPSTISKIKGSIIEFKNEMSEKFDAIIFATGYESTVRYWLKENELFNENGFPKPDLPCHWKGKNNIYSAGFSRRGLFGISQRRTKHS